MKKITELFTRPIAHRGLHDDRRVENSLSAFAAAIEKRLPFELDIHLMKDGTIVVHHDDSLKRLCGVDRLLKEMTLTELKAITFTGSNERVPTFAEVLDLTQGQVPILVELKISNTFDPAFAEALLKLLEAYPYKDKIALQSFNPYAVRWLKDHTDDYLVGQLSSAKLPGQKAHVQLLFKTLLVNRISHPDFVSFDVTHLPSCFVKWARRRRPIIAWTIDDEKKRKTALENADQFIFERINI
ncbi:MAG: glycerophosphodiester phosphodiesterase family protein [Bacilli bacterium]|jgi:glycerophosphoryl diester phosphodiesterase